MRSYGITNCAPYASAPAVGAAGDTYFNTTNKTLYISDGTSWNAVDAGGGITTLDSGWHYLDAPGEPVCAVNRYDPAGKNWPPGRFRRDAAGCVFMELMATGVINTTGKIFTLPVGFRPAYTLYLACGMGVSGQGVVTVKPNGDVSIIAGSTTSTWIQLSTSFMADDAQTINWVPMTALQNGWVATGTGAENTGCGPPSYFVDNVGDIHLAGSISFGNSGGGLPFFTLPIECAPTDGQLIFPTCCGRGSPMGPAQHARIDLKTDGGLTVAGYTGSGANNWVSLDGIVISAPKANWFVPALLASWVAYGGVFAVPSFYINRNGICAIRGLMKGGTITAPTTIVAANGLPIPPTYQQATLVDAASNAISRIDCLPDGSMQVVGFFNGGTNGYVSWNGRFFARG